MEATLPPIVVGRVRKPHGLKGELAVFPLTDDPATAFVAGREYTLLDLAGQSRGVVTLAQVKQYHRELLVQLQGHPDRDALERYRGLFLALDRSLLPPLQEGEVYLQELVGFAVQDSQGEALGLVSSVYELPQGPMLEIQGSEREFLLPFHGEYVRQTDRAGKRLIVTVPAGLLE